MIGLALPEDRKLSNDNPFRSPQTERPSVRAEKPRTAPRARPRSRTASRPKPRPIPLTTWINYLAGGAEFVAAVVLSILIRGLAPTGADPALVMHQAAASIGLMVRAGILWIAGYGVHNGRVWGAVLTLLMAMLSFGAGWLEMARTGSLLALIPMVYGLFAFAAVVAERRLFMPR